VAPPVQHRTQAAAAEVSSLAVDSRRRSGISEGGEFSRNKLQENSVAQALASLALRRCVHVVEYSQPRCDLSIARTE
jgi:hypothetical protein